ncbi:EcsC family protein [Planosporangium mesophilum]|uniref:Uncharacterized protein n=1 Tax=Planosporangium mesophilum TaxID=689768 RepID=A0A8J3THX7_9ACTN|nr:EcsC family protein [Planosporangium mesophilum]NJC82529.1 EcsC family protein [Planosporangium mesophilum]GII25467.1 hypothetical protein Pme01_50640 [Planosporangium mesophilum]
MEDDKTAATPRKRAAKAKPNDTSDPSAAAEQATTGAGRTPRPRKIPPATFVPPVPPDAAAEPKPPAKAAVGRPDPTPPAPSQRPADPTETSATPAGSGAARAERRPPAKKAAAKAAKKAAKKATPAARPPQDQVQPSAAPAESPTPAPATAKKAPAKKAPAKKAPAKPEEATKPVEAVTAEMTPKPVDAVKPAEASKVMAPLTAPAVPPTPIAARPAPTPPPTSVQRHLWPIIKTSPGYATELLALAAVERLGPQAADHLRWLRDTYPGADPDGLARIAAARSVRQARTQGAMAGLVGPLAVFAETAALLWLQARLVLDIAAVYGREPADPDRAAELLTLLGVHPDATAARQALAVAREVVDDGPDGGYDAPRVTVPLVRVAGRAVMRMSTARQAARIVPGAGAALTAILDGRSTELLAARAAKLYRG